MDKNCSEENESWVSCCHEAAHAVAAYLCGFEICYASMRPPGKGSSCVLINCGCFYSLSYQNLFVLLAGAVGENIAFKPVVPYLTPSTSGDLLQSSWLLFLLRYNKQEDRDDIFLRFRKDKFTWSHDGDWAQKIIERMLVDIDQALRQRSTWAVFQELAVRFEEAMIERREYVPGEDILTILNSHIEGGRSIVTTPSWFERELARHEIERVSLDEINEAYRVIDELDCPPMPDC